MVTQLRAARASMNITWGLTRKLIVTALLLSTLAGSALAMGARPPAAGMPAAGFSLTDLHGKAHSLEQYKGKIVLVNFWATWCKPCVQEMPELVSLQKELANQNVQLLGIGIDSPSNISEFAEKYQISYPVFAAGMEGTTLSGAMGNKAGGLPFTVLISSSGQIVKTYFGKLKMDELKADIQKLNTK